MDSVCAPSSSRFGPHTKAGAGFVFLLLGGGPPTISSTSGLRGSAATTLFKRRFCMAQASCSIQNPCRVPPRVPPSGAILRPLVRPRKQGGGEDPCAPFKEFQSNLCKPPCYTAVARGTGGIKMQPPRELSVLPGCMASEPTNGNFRGHGGSGSCKAESEVPQGCVHTPSKNSWVPPPRCLSGLCDPFLNCSPGSESATL